MRTTIDLDAAVDARLRAHARERNLPLEAVINDALRAGTRAAHGPADSSRVPGLRRRDPLRDAGARS
jgi:hypothetical protein